MEEPEPREVNGDAGETNGLAGRERADGAPEKESVSGGPVEEVPTGEVPADGVERDGAEVAESDELRGRLEVKDRHIRELYDELAAARLAADEARARVEASELRVGDLEEERAHLKERLADLEEEERRRRRRGEGQDRRARRLERELQRREADIRRLEDLLEEKEQEMDAYVQEYRGEISRKNVALDNALSRIEGLQRDLEERENEAAELRATVDELRADLDLQHERQRRMAEPENRLRAGIDLFNESQHLQSVGSISKSLGQPEVRVTLGDGNEPPVILVFAWGDVTRRTYAANPGLAVKEPRVYQMSPNEAPPGLDRKSPNAHVGPDGRVILGL